MHVMPIHQYHTRIYVTRRMAIKRIKLKFNFNIMIRLKIQTITYAHVIILYIIIKHCLYTLKILNNVCLFVYPL